MEMNRTIDLLKDRIKASTHVFAWPPSTLLIITVFTLHFIFYFGATSSFAQNCRQQVENLYVENAQANREAYLLDYSVNIRYREAGLVHTERLKLGVKDGKARVESTNYEIYQDQEVMVSVLHDQKTLFISDKVEGLIREKQVMNIMSLQDSLISNASMIQCETVMLDGKELVRAKITLGEEVRNKHAIDQFSLWFDLEGESMQLARVTYKKGPITSLEVKVHKYDKHFKGTTFQGNALEQVFDGQVLRIPYRNYKLIDARKNKSPHGFTNN